jgi:hypothetical protein
MPGLPDPHIDPKGQPDFPPGSVIPPESRRGCQGLLDRLVGNGGNAMPTATQLAALLEFARCMRGHGIHDWPDPQPNGTFVPDTRIRTAPKSVFVGQLRVCERLNPDPRGRVYFSAG